jgi:CheY-like chemotaxis protein
MRDSIRILLVEDEVIIAMLVQEQMRDVGYESLTFVTTGEKAIAQARQDPPDLVLLDIGLSGKIDGLEAASVICAEMGIPIAFISGYADAAILEKAQSLKPLGFFSKPLEIEELKAAIDTHFGLN